MKSKQDKSLDQVLQHVDERRRRFLGKLLAGGAAAAAIPAMTAIALGDDQAAGGKGKGGKGKGGKGGPPDPAMLAARLIQNFDKDGDKALNQAELTAALKEMMARRMGKGKGDGKGKGGKGKGDRG